jgi:7,8-dihydro-6-hydroxymethylpterin dimethyltransferase
VNTLLDYRLVEYTQSLCSTCLRVVPAKIVEKEGGIYLLKDCREHGQQWALREENAGYYLKRREYDRPGKTSLSQNGTEKGCPFDCGLCTAHEQHTCIGLIEVTSACDQACPVCYADSGRGSHLGLDQISRMLEFLQRCENGCAEIVQISGGEPTSHPQILEILRLAKEHKFKYVMLNTNGLRISQDREFVEKLGEFAGGFEVYLQLDGVDSGSSVAMRGRQVSDFKQEALARLSDAGISTTLAATVARGVNEQELGRLIYLGLKTPGVRGINLQPLAYFGRLPDSLKQNQPITIGGIMGLIEAQMDGMLKAEDFVPLPCNVERVALSFLMRRGQAFTPLTRVVQVRDYLEFLDSTFAYDLDELLKRAEFSPARGCCNLGQFFERLKQFIPLDFKNRSLAERRQFVDQNTFRISIVSFVDALNFDMKSIKKECVHVITPDLQRIPFSAYNIFHRARYADAA